MIYCTPTNTVSCLKDPLNITSCKLVQTMNYVSQALDEGNYCIAVFLDLKKAFNVCNHESLLKKLFKMGVRFKYYC